MIENEHETEEALSRFKPQFVAALRTLEELSDDLVKEIFAARDAEDILKVHCLTAVHTGVTFAGLTLSHAGKDLQETMDKMPKPEEVTCD